MTFNPMGPPSVEDLVTKAFGSDRTSDEETGQGVWGSTPGVPPVPTPAADPTALPPVGDYGVDRIKGQIDRIARQKAPSDKAYEEAMNEEKTNAGFEAADYHGIESQVTKLVNTQQQLGQTYRNALADARANMDKAYRYADYAKLDPTEVDKYTAISDDKEGRYTPEQKRAAQLALKRGSEVDPNRLLSTAGNRVLAAIAMSMGAYAATLGHSPNYAMQIINDAIERDVLAQKAQFEGADRRAKRTESVYARIREQFTDERDATAATHALLLKQAGMLAEKYRALNLGPQIDAQIAQHEQTIADNHVSRSIDAYTREANIANQQRQGDLEAQKNRILSDKVNDQNKSFVPGGWKVEDGQRAPPQAQSREATKIAAQYAATNALLDDVIKTRGAMGPELLNRYGVSDARAMHALLVGEMRKVLGTGANLSPAEKEALDRAVGGDPTDFKVLLPALNATKRGLERSTRAKMKVYHLSPEVDNSLASMQPGFQ